MNADIVLDEELLARARVVSGIDETSTLLLEGLRALIERESARSVFHIDAEEPGVEVAPLRRWASNVRGEAFALAAHHQSLAVAADLKEPDDQAFINAISGLSDR